MSQEGSESSGYSTSASASSEFGSLEDHFKFPRAAPKRKVNEHIDGLNEMLKESLTLSPEKRVRLVSASSVSNIGENANKEKNGRPPTRRSTSSDIELSPRVRSLRASNSGNTTEMIRTVSTVSPKFFKQFYSPKKRISLNENVYSRHRLGKTFSPLVAGAKRKVATPIIKTQERHSPADVPRKSSLRNSSAIRAKRPLSDRLRFDILD